ncbi:serine/threonine-protein kinase-like protein ACR4 [Olea europaea var. sylvestris]|uniref:serine/threonine-protein kinase-like protein ACR4 n=1 Tax=Olea europaea var. sylvestris TaxID=158386 RepID=UPI000C1D29F6|nr:serine/threonine-protein kinase-like protein ACR4 [Olea europaea var. sylvestris]
MRYDDQIIIIYDFLLAFLSISIIILVVLLLIFCKKKPIKAEETLRPAKRFACSYSLMEIDAATERFNDRRVIGKGHLGTVYAAVMPPNGEIVAVKRIHPWLVLNNPGFGFSSKLKWLSLAENPHLVPVLGFSEAPGERIIVMEFGGMLSLDFYLHQNSDGAALMDWQRRLRIAAGVARGIEYLHEVVAPPIIHGCIKPSNILIDEKFRAKISDYGLYFMAARERQGLVGYVDEEYWLEKRGASKESDIYGFGVVLLELLSGKKSEQGLLVKWAIPLIKGMKFSDLLDPRLAIPCDIKPLVRLARVALACVGNSRKSRVSIVQVATILNNLEIEL